MAQGKLPAVSLVVSIFVLIQFAGCKDSGSVGSTFPGAGADVKVDTLQLSELNADNLEGTSGSLTFFSIGAFQDPAFGDISATGLVKPQLGSPADSISVGSETRAQLRLAINKEQVYGDSLAAVQFEVFELANVFRGNEVDVSDDVQTTGSSVGSFSVTNEDTILVDLDDSWFQKYAEFYSDTSDTRDSLYVRQFPGLAIVPQNSAKILAITPSESEFIISGLSIAGNPDSTIADTLGLSQTAFTVDRSNVPAGTSGSRIIHNTFENVVWFDFDFSPENLDARNIAQVKLVIYRDNITLDNTLLGTNEVRPLNGNLRLHVVDQDELPQSIDPGNPIGSFVNTGAYQADDEAYYIDITAPVVSGVLDETESDEVFYLTYGRNGGLIRSSIVYDTDAPADKRPKIIITSTQTENN